MATDGALHGHRRLFGVHHQVELFPRAPHVAYANSLLPRRVTGSSQVARGTAVTIQILGAIGVVVPVLDNQLVLHRKRVAARGDQVPLFAVLAPPHVVVQHGFLSPSISIFVPTQRSNGFLDGNVFQLPSTATHYKDTAAKGQRGHVAPWGPHATAVGFALRVTAALHPLVPHFVCSSVDVGFVNALDAIRSTKFNAGSGAGQRILVGDPHRWFVPVRDLFPFDFGHQCWQRKTTPMFFHGGGVGLPLSPTERPDIVHVGPFLLPGAAHVRVAAQH